MLKSVSFDLHKGEVLGIAGMLGSGPHRTATCDLRRRPADGANIRVDGRRVEDVSIQTMKRLGIGYTSEDRKESGLVQDPFDPRQSLPGRHAALQPSRFRHRAK